MSFTVVLRGFNVSVAILDAFLTANGSDETDGTPPLKKKGSDIMTLLRTKMGSDQCDARILFPQSEGFNRSTVAYIAYSSIPVFVQREIRLGVDLPEEMPPEFDTLRKEMLSFASTHDGILQDWEGSVGFYVVMTGQIGWAPQVLLERNKPPIPCDSCDRFFDTFDDRQQHRRVYHGSIEGNNPLLEA